MSATGGPQGSARRGEVYLSDLIIDPAYQIRSKVDPATVARYVDVKKSGGELPAIRVMVVEGAPTLVDGWHRVEAARKIGEAFVIAEITEGTEADLRWAAAMANLAHGLQYKKAELRNVLRVYVDADRHLARGRKPKSARDIGRDCGGIPHNTVLRWLKEDFPHVHRAMAIGTVEGKANTGGLQPLQERRQVAALKALSEAAANARGVSDPARRALIIERLRAMADQMEEVMPWVPERVSSEW